MPLRAHILEHGQHLFSKSFLSCLTLLHESHDFSHFSILGAARPAEAVTQSTFLLDFRHLIINDQNLSIGMKIAVLSSGLAGIGEVARRSGGIVRQGKNQWILARFHDGIFCREAPG